ncbi:putative iron-sulfur protein [uncultured Alphaproteobacteria bacterium]|uniref:Putative iron-sulfur protein n=1 Tax=uncultured Alphaproteobacteria bacterium TaxID=91750 RepID=A0A212K615_9PROT|nr:putative iron-sulfur protein [uncultured Alphaproteobacteria bacterium]
MIEAIVGLTALGGGLGVFLGIAARRLHVDAPSLDGELAELLPGQNCGQCGYPGCAAAAAALARGEAAVTVCPPGGRATAQALAARLCVEIDLSAVADAAPRAAHVDESLCIGCTRCARKCPTDAIVGAAKQAHTVIADVCSGCGACVAACPVEGISLRPLPVTLQSWYWPKPDDGVPRQ